MKCKNIECENETEEKKVYCSLTCRNYYVNKYMRNYDKVKETFKKKKEESINEYLKEPKKCKHCDEVIEFDKRDNSYCGSSCMATFTNKGKKHSEETIIKMRKSANKKLEESGYEQYKECKKEDCINKIEKKLNRSLYCSDGCRKSNKRKNMTDIKKYRSMTKFKFNLADYNEEFDFTLVEKYGWYSPTNKKNNLDGVSRDHIYSVMEGFENNINPHLLSHPANCQLMIHNDNISKNKNCDITLEELAEKIEKWESKYGSYLRQYGPLSPSEKGTWLSPM